MTDTSFTVIHESSRTDPRHYVRPDDFDLENLDTLTSCFGKSEVETTARNLLALFQTRGHWSPFTIRELARFYESRGWHPDAMFYGLTGAWDHDIGMWRESPPYLATDEDGNRNYVNIQSEINPAKRCLPAQPATATPRFEVMIASSVYHVGFGI